MEKLNQWLTLLANLGVLAGIGFLAYEIRQNTEAIHAQTSEAVLAATYTELQAVRDDPQLIQSIITQEKLSEADQIRLYTWLVSALRVREFSWIQRQNGVIDDAQWESELAVTTAILQAPKVRLWWKRVGHKTVGPSFRTFVQELIDTIPESNGIYEEQTQWAN